jgi:hypothetical protein
MTATLDIHHPLGDEKIELDETEGDDLETSPSSQCRLPWWAIIAITISSIAAIFIVILIVLSQTVCYVPPPPSPPCHGVCVRPLAKREATNSTQSPSVPTQLPIYCNLANDILQTIGIGFLCLILILCVCAAAISPCAACL